MDRRAAELDEIDRFMAGRGATYIRPAFVGAVKGALPLPEERSRITALKVGKAGQSWLEKNRSRRPRKG